MLHSALKANNVAKKLDGRGRCGFSVIFTSPLFYFLSAAPPIPQKKLFQSSEVCRAEKVRTDAETK